MQAVKCLVLGDTAVGKTKLLTSYTADGFPSECIPNVVNNYSATVIFGNRPIHLGLWETLDQEDYDVFLICFSIVCPSSFLNVKRRWIKEVRHFSPRAPVLLVGLKEDLRSDKATLDALKQKNLAPITFSQGRSLANDIDAVKYLECSSISQKGMGVVFEDALRAVILPLPKRNRKCTVL